VEMSLLLLTICLIGKVAASTIVIVIQYLRHRQRTMMKAMIMMNTMYHVKKMTQN
jgi:hypothetical protein